MGSYHQREPVQHQPLKERPELVERWRVAVTHVCGRAMEVALRRESREHRRLALGAPQRVHRDRGRRPREVPFRGVDIRAAAVQVATVRVAAHHATEVVRAAALPRAADALRSRDD